MSEEFPRIVVRLLFEVLCYPVRDKNPIIVLAYIMAMFAGVVLTGYLITLAIPQSPYQR